MQENKTSHHFFWFAYNHTSAAAAGSVRREKRLSSILSTSSYKMLDNMWKPSKVSISCGDTNHHNHQPNQKRLERRSFFFGALDYFTLDEACVTGWQKRTAPTQTFNQTIKDMQNNENTTMRHPN